MLRQWERGDDAVFSPLDPDVKDHAGDRCMVAGYEYASGGGMFRLYTILFANGDMLANVLGSWLIPVPALEAMREAVQRR